MNDLIDSSSQCGESGRAERRSDARGVSRTRLGAPRHLALITDSDPLGSWLCHEHGSPSRCVRALRHAVFAARAAQIRYVTLNTFGRVGSGQCAEPGASVLAGMLLEFIVRTQSDLLQTGICVRALGNVEHLPSPLKQAFQGLCAATNVGQSMTLTVAVAYDGPTEIALVARGSAAASRVNRQSQPAIDERSLRNRFAGRALPPVDLALYTNTSSRSEFLPFELGSASKVDLGLPLATLRPKHLGAALDHYAADQI